MKRKYLIGQIVKINPGKTAVVVVGSVRRHARYQKILKRSRKFLADNGLAAKLSQTVRITESRPLSRRKRFVVSKVINSS